VSADVRTVLALVARGWHVFPVDSPELDRCAGVGDGHDPATCRDRGKHPCVSWSTKASTDAQDVAAWFTGNPRNVGIACGPSGLLVIDEDEPGGLEKYASEVGAEVPDTLTVSTGRGTHFYFAADAHDFGNAEHALKGYGVNVRGRGGYVVGPGSTHASGAVYAITRDVEPAPLPSWLVQALTPLQQAQAPDATAPRGLDALPQVIRAGDRHNTLMPYASSLRARNVPLSEAEHLFRLAWGRCEQPPNDPMAWNEALGTLRDVYERYGVSQWYTDPPLVTVLDAGPGTSTISSDGLLGRMLRRSELADLPPLHPLVTGLLDYPTAAVLVGAYGTGKTFLVLAPACCVATGRPWLGRPVERRKVLLVVGEGGSGLDRRIAAWEQGYNRGQPVGDDDLIVMVQPRSLTDINVWQRIAETCVAEGIGFVILDTFSSLAPEADETKDAARVLANMHRVVAAINGTVLLVHHPGWGDSERTRGGYQFEANADTVLVLTGSPDDALVQLRRKKVKDGEGGQVIWMRRTPFQLHGEHLGETSVVMQAVDSSQAGVPIIERIKLVLDACGEVGATGPQIQEELGDGIPRSTFYSALNRAVDEGIAVKQGSGNRQRYFARGEA
jgi:hypothetical protein